MIRKTVAGWILLVWLGAPAAGQEWARKMFQTTSHDFGTVARGAKAEHRFEFTNLWMEDVRVSGVRTSCSCTSVSVVSPTLKTYQKGEIVAKFNTDRFLGSRSATISVTFDRPRPAIVQLQVKGAIRTDIVVDPPGVNLGEVEQGTPVARRVTVTRNGRPGWKIVEVRSANPHLSAEFVGTQPDGYRVGVTLEVRLDEGAPIGYIRDHLILLTNDPSWPSVAVQVDGRVLPAVSVSPESLFLGVLRPGESATKQVVIRAGEPFRVTAVATDGTRVRAAAAASDTARTLHVLPITFTAGDEAGKVEQTICCETDLECAAPVVTVMAVVQP